MYPSLSYWLLLTLRGLDCLRLAKLEVPEAVLRGRPVWLNCSYDLESDQLYSIKWYRNNVEFYRYLPSDRPPAQKYDLHGAYLDLGISRLGNVYLYRTDLNSEGVYRCEVSAEAPSFQTVREEKEMKIYVLPEHGPKIVGTRTHYEVGQEVNANCSSAASKPAAVLRWYLNDKQVPDRLLIKYPPSRFLDGLETTTLGLRFRVDRNRFWEGAMNLRCTSVVFHTYTTSKEEIVFNNDIHPSNLQSGTSNSEGPTIKGIHRRYKPSDRVNATCVSYRSIPPASIKWYINDEEADSSFLLHSPTIIYPDGKKSTVVGLSFVVYREHFIKDELRLKCASTVSKVINQSSREAVLRSLKPHPDSSVSQTVEALLNTAVSHQHLFLRLFFVCLLISTVS
ncbi:uncharacterized protein [Centruroides vittatus]|uniref:uncharacterized protein n=1 Tax=Centruroides vittatus TaxID=120091 RepID=UPI00350FF053